RRRASAAPPPVGPKLARWPGGRWPRGTGGRTAGGAGGGPRPPPRGPKSSPSPPPAGPPPTTQHEVCWTPTTSSDGSGFATTVAGCAIASPNAAELVIGLTSPTHFAG